MLKAFQDHINQNLPFLLEGKLLVAISGGIDSVVLTQLCYLSNLNIALAHCNFNLRGKESDADEDFVLQLAEDLELEVFIESFDTQTYANDNKMSTQMAARELRYEWFAALSDHLNFDFVLTAHHADDNLETFLINLSRGTGLDGLKGIPEVNGTIIRPLLSFARTDIEAFAKDEKLEWREDKSNASSKYLRNAIRLEVIPRLKALNPQLLQNFKLTLDHLQDTSLIVDDRIDDISDEIIDVKYEEIKFNIELIKRLNSPKAYLYELLKEYGFTEWNDVLDLLDAQSGKQLFSKSWCLLKDRDVLILTEKRPKENQHYSIVQTDKELHFEAGKLVFDESKTPLNNSRSKILIDLDKIEFPLTLRKWEKGDVFYPEGMSGSKKLSKYFKDEKLSLLEKEKVWLLCSNQNIVWVINRRLDRRFIPSKQSKRLLKISFIELK